MCVRLISAALLARSYRRKTHSVSKQLSDALETSSRGVRFIYLPLRRRESLPISQQKRAIGIAIRRLVKVLRCCWAPRPAVTGERPPPPALPVYVLLAMGERGGGGGGGSRPLKAPLPRKRRTGAQQSAGLLARSQRAEPAAWRGHRALARRRARKSSERALQEHHARARPRGTRNVLCNVLGPTTRPWGGDGGCSRGGVPPATREGVYSGSGPGCR